MALGGSVKGMGHHLPSWLAVKSAKKLQTISVTLGLDYLGLGRLPTGGFRADDRGDRPFVKVAMDDQRPTTDRPHLAKSGLSGFENVAEVGCHSIPINA